MASNIAGEKAADSDVETSLHSEKGIDLAVKDEKYLGKIGKGPHWGDHGGRGRK